MTSATAVSRDAANDVVTRRARLARDSWIMARRDLQHWIAQPAPVVISLLFPVLTLLMFGYLFGGALTVPGGGSYREFLVPGMFVTTMLFGIEGTMAAVSVDAARGVTDRFRSIPMAAGAVVAGRCIADMLSSVAGLAVIIAAGLATGWRWPGTAGNVALALALLLMLRFALLWLGIYLGLMVKGPQAVTGVQILVWPLGFLSSIFVAPSTMPAWLGAIAQWNPLSATATATRHLFGNPGVAGDAWAARHAALLAIAWPVLITAAFLPLAVYRYRHLDR
jgi:ABC-type multidrug transport system permease subunit